MICFDVDTALAEVPVNTVPLTDDTDFKSIESAVAFNAAGMALYWHFVTPAGAYTATQVTPTSAGTYDWAHQQQGMYTIEIPASGGASINNDTEGFGWFTGSATGVLPWRSPTMCFRAAGLNDLLIESAFSATRGLAGTALPNAAAEAAGGLFTRGSGAGQINQPASGQIDVNVHRWLTGTPNALSSGRVEALVGAMGTDVITDTAIAASALTEIRTNLHGLDVALSVNASGRVQIAETQIDQIVDEVWDEDATGHQTVGSFGATIGDGDTAAISILEGVAIAAGNTDTIINWNGSQFTAIPWNATWDAEVQSEVDDGLKALGLDHLVSASVAGADVVDNSIMARLVSKAATADWDTYNHTTDSLEAHRDWNQDVPSTVNDINSLVALLQQEWADGGRLDNILDSRASQASVDVIDDFIDTEIAAILAAVDTEIGTILTRIGNPAVSLASDLAAIQSDVDAIGLDVDGLVTSLATVTGYVDTVEAMLIQVKAAVYDSAPVSGDNITLSDGAIQNVTAAGRVLTPPP